MKILRASCLVLMGCILMTLSHGQPALSPTQSLRTLDGADSLFVRGFPPKNDFRVTYLSQRYLLEYGSKRGEAPNGGGVFTNTSDLLGAGLTYKFIDIDVAFSLPQSRVLQTGLQNLQQFRLSGSFSFRRWTIRGYWLQSTGLVAADPAGQFISTPSVDMLSLGIPFTYYFNHSRYSYRSAAFQSEVQLRSSGSVLMRIEPFYRRLGVGTSLVPSSLDVAATYGEQAGLQYVHAPGVVVMPGYGYNLTTKNGRWFFSPMIFAGAGVAVNVYKGNVGERTSVNAEWKASGVLNAGYNGRRWYAAFRSSYELDYFLVDPSYFFTSDVKLGVTVGYRFRELEKFLPESLF